MRSNTKCRIIAKCRNIKSLIRCHTSIVSVAVYPLILSSQLSKQTVVQLVQYLRNFLNVHLCHECGWQLRNLLSITHAFPNLHYLKSCWRIYRIVTKVIFNDTDRLNNFINQPISIIFPSTNVNFSNGHRHEQSDLNHEERLDIVSS